MGQNKIKSKVISIDSIGVTDNSKPGCSGVYLEGQVDTIPVLFTADTGASRTILSDRVYNKIPSKQRPKLKKKMYLKTASGDPLTSLGEATFEIQLGQLKFKQPMIVAHIEDDVLLGIDVLHDEIKGSANILLGEGIMQFRGKTLSCINIESTKRARRVTMADTSVIPGHSEILVDAFVEREVTDDYGSGDVIIEPTNTFSETYSLVMASALTNVKNKTTVKVRLMNPFNQDITINQDALIGIAETHGNVDEWEISLSEEDKTQLDTSSVRKISIHDESSSHEDGHGNVSIKTLPNHLKDLYTRATEGCHSESEKNKVEKLLSDYETVFSCNESDLGVTNLAEHTIDTGDARPIKQRPRKTPMAFSGEEQEAIQELENKGVIRKSTSPWASPIVLVRKKNGKVRPCVDYRRLNAVTTKDAFPLPRIQDCLDAVAGAKYFSTFDLTSGYHQIPVREKDIPKTAFVTKYGLYEFSSMPFGLTNAPATFQRVMELALQGLQWEQCLIYLDDIIVFGSTFGEHIQRVFQVLARIKKAGLKLQPSKCHLLQRKVTFLGHVVSADGVLPNPENVSKVKTWPIPTSVTEIRQFLGLASYYRRFIQNFAAIARPMVELTKKSVPFQWTSQCDEAFEKLKSKLISPEIMAYPIDDCGYILDTDACDVSIGAVISQVQNNQERVIAYASRTLSKSERNYCVTDRELLAVKYFMEYFRQYLLGRSFLVRTDHQALVWLLSLKEPKSRIARWLETMSEYHFSVEYRPGKKHSNADGMSRCPNPYACRCPDSDNFHNLKCGPCNKCRQRATDMESSLLLRRVHKVPNKHFTQNIYQAILCVVMFLVNLLPGNINSDHSDGLLIRTMKTRSADRNISPTANTQNKTTDWIPWAGIYASSTLKRMQEKDPDIGLILQSMESGERPLPAVVSKESPATRHYWIQWDKLKIKDGLLFRKFHKRDDTGEYLQFLVPCSMGKEVFLQMHNTLLSGHLGAGKTRGKTTQRFYWFEMREDLNNWVKQCDICAVNKAPSKKPCAPLGSMIVGAPLDRIAIDVMGPLPITPRKNRYVLVITDHFTKWVEIFPIPDQTAVTCANILLNEIIARFGTPLDLHSDQGRNFESEIFSELCRLLEIRKTRTSARHPQCNGQVERFNKTMIKMIKSYLRGEQTNWDLNLGCLTAAYRATPHESTGLTPNIMMLGREVRLPSEIVYGSCSVSEGKITAYGDYVDHLRERLEKAHRVARQHLAVAARRQKDFYDVKVSLNVYNPGDLVWCLKEDRQENISPKLQPAYSGPYLIIQKYGLQDYRIQLNKDGKNKLVHHNKLKPYLGINPPSWAKRALNKWKK